MSRRLVPSPYRSGQSRSRSRCKKVFRAGAANYIRVKDRMTTYLTAFAGHHLIARGDLHAVAPIAHAHADQPMLIFDDATGRPVELDLRGSIDEVIGRLPSPHGEAKPTRGRPKLGVTAREVTLLPRHWDWLATQPGGASAALRRLVDQARRDSGAADIARQAQEVTYRVMTALAGDLPNYEEATRALFANDRRRFDQLTAAWPSDTGDYVRELNARADAPST
jgi:uncharacterized protein